MILLLRTAAVEQLYAEVSECTLVFSAATRSHTYAR
jgi:hypothetical protein